MKPRSGSKPAGERVGRLFTSDSMGLIALAFFAFLRVSSYNSWRFKLEYEPTHWLEGLLPPGGWSLFWLAVSFVCAAAVFWQWLIPAAVGISVAVNALWALSYFQLWWVSGHEYAYMDALGYLSVTFFAAWGFGRGRSSCLGCIKRRE